MKKDWKIKIYMCIPKRIRENIYISIKKIRNKKNKITFNEMVKSDIYQDWGKYNLEKKYWIKGYKNVSYISDDGLKQSEFFFKDKITLIRCNIKKESNNILICLIKNDLTRLKKFMEHYRKIGVKHFVFIDNDSNDGTYEYLLEQNDVDLFQIKERYSTIRRQAWINRIISYYGYGKWYIIVDSDELLLYNELYEHNIDDLIKYANDKKINRIRALMIDMYPSNLMLGSNKEIDYIKEFRFFDVDTYIALQNKFFENIIGGMRGRIFNDDNNKIFLIKYPVIYLKKGTIQYNSHYSYPFYENFNRELNTCLLHYKFLPDDLKKIKEIVINKTFASGSKEYKKYLNLYEKNPQMKLTYAGTAELKDIIDVYEIKLLKKIKWK